MIKLQPSDYKMQFYFVRSGDIELYNEAGTLKYGSVSGSDWSSRTANTLATAYRLGLNATVSLPSAGPSQRYYAYSLRCLSTVLDI